MKLNNMKRLERAENTMLIWMCGVTLSDRKRTVEVMDYLRNVSVERWYAVDD